jgi:hypothetical protein
MKQIKIGKRVRHLITVDDRDYDLVNSYTWSVGIRNNYIQITGYKSSEISKGKKISIGRLILGLESGDKRVADHVNGDVFNNTRTNLRIATVHQNTMNRKKSSNTHCTSKYIGVGYLHGKIRARIRTDGHERFLGFFDKEELAALAYNKAAKELFGDFARLNILPDKYGKLCYPHTGYFGFQITN